MHGQNHIKFQVNPFSGSRVAPCVRNCVFCMDHRTNGGYFPTQF